jgi:hypothetical protein
VPVIVVEIIIPVKPLCPLTLIAGTAYNPTARTSPSRMFSPSKWSPSSPSPPQIFFPLYQLQSRHRSVLWFGPYGGEGRALDAPT